MRRCSPRKTSKLGKRAEARAGDDRGEVEKKPLDQVREDIDAVLRTIYDPEIPVNIVDLGLIYDVAIDVQQNVEISMTLTAPACPVAGMLVRRVATKVGDLGVVSQLPCAPDLGSALVA